MIKLQTTVDAGRSRFGISLSNHILMLGSCFADGIGVKLVSGGFDVSVNPFGTLYNPVSILNSLERINTGRHYSESDAVMMGAGSGLWCSHSHHTSFARAGVADFLADANASLDAAHSFWERCDRIIITLGTSWVWEKDGQVVSNCLKRNASEFVHRALSVSEVTAALEGILSLAGSARKVIFTISPVRHLWNGAHSNQISKATLLIASDAVMSAHADTAEYFPAYETVLDELRDYRFYGDDMTHPTALAVWCVWEKFRDFAVPAVEFDDIARAMKASRAAGHRPLR